MSFRDSNTTIQTVINETSILNASNDHLSGVPAIPPAKLKAKPKDCEGVWSLPFTAIEPEDENEPNFWTVPAAGSFTGGAKVGKAMACAYLSYLRVNENQDFLSSIVDSFSLRVDAAGGESMSLLEYDKQSIEYISLISQRYGFFEAIGSYLKNSLASERHNFGFDCLDNDDFIAMANDGLSYDSNWRD